MANEPLLRRMAATIERFSCISGHFDYGLHERWGVTDAVYITFVRDPVDRLLSLANLTRFPIVGLTDQFDATIRRWAPLLGWGDIQYKHRLAQPDRLKQENLPASLVKAVRQRQQYDQALYECILNRDWADG